MYFIEKAESQNVEKSLLSSTPAFFVPKIIFQANRRVV